MRILLLAHSFNSLTQRLFVELRELGHDVTIEFDVNERVTVEAVALARPEVIIAPFLKRAIPAEVHARHLCLVVHPGPPGDRGPAALDWAIRDGAADWGVTVLEATAELDGGPVWDSAAFAMRKATKSSLYRNEVTEAAVAAVLRCLSRLPGGWGKPAPAGQWRPPLRQADRAIDWSGDDTRTVLRKIRSADGIPGLVDAIDGEAISLFDARPAPGLSGAPGTLIARCDQAVARATTDGAIWLGHLRRRDGDHPLKLPAALVLGQRFAALPEASGWSDIGYEERGAVGYLHFAFYNGAMSTGQCRRLLAAYQAALARPTRVLVLMGGPDYWSNGIHLNVIEAADSPAEESLANIEAIDDLAEAIIATGDKLTIAALQGSAGAGGVFLALAADMVLARSGVVLNPHYKGMGNLYGSEYWTYLLPRRCGAAVAEALVEARLPMGTAEARRLRLIDDAFGADGPGFVAGVAALAEMMATDPGLAGLLADKRRRRAADEAAKPLEQYRREELERLKLNFFGFDPSYHVARYNFVHKVAKSRTPLYLAAHRRKPAAPG